jgi:GDP-mannose 6-dehydrogenase
MKRNVSIFGLGYVGSVTAACLASKGNTVIGVDVNRDKVAALNGGRTPILERGMEEMVSACHEKQILRATTHSEEAIRDSEISFISVGTPSQRTGKLDLGAIGQVSREIGRALAKKTTFHWIILRSTVLPGTTETFLTPALESESGKRAGKDFAVCFVPEFLREGTAVEDFFQPPFTVIGTSCPDQIAALRELYSWCSAPLYETTIASAEMVKYACNAFHALKVGFANEIGTMCKHLAVDTETVSKIFCSDTQLNISAAYLKPGFAFGGSCLPKDLRALTYRAKELDLKLPLLNSLLPSNNEHIERAVEAVLNTKKRKIGILGLSFKPGTDDLRESPLVHLVKRLVGEGCEIQIWDKNVALGRLIGSNRQFIQDEIPHIGSLLNENAEVVMEKAEVLILGTKAFTKEKLLEKLRPDQMLLDLVCLDKSQRYEGPANHEGICW